MLRRTMATAAAAVLALSLAACGGDDDEGGTEPEVEAADDLSGVPAELSEQGSIKIGVKFDQPGIGIMEPGSDEPSGFDIEIGKILAGKMGIAAGDIEWIETVSDSREPFLQNGTVDLVIASYSITDERRQVVGQAGPYYVTGQQLLVRTEDEDRITGPEALADVKVCSVEGSTSLARVEDEYGAAPVPFSTYSECVTQLENGTVDAVTTDGSILLGYAAQNPEELVVVGEPFSEERYGVGYAQDAEGMCEFINTSLEESFEDDSWADAFEATLGQSGVETPEPPAVDPCQ